MNKPAHVVLLIDDEPKIRRFLRAGFELNGFSVLEAENGADALKLATFSPPDLVILDLALPDLHGSEVLERLRSWSNVPVIILSVISGEDEKVRLLQAGADDYWSSHSAWPSSWRGAKRRCAATSRARRRIR